MTDYKHEEFNPEEFWPEAEKMLDRHFAARRKRRVLLLLAFLLVGFSTSYFLLHKTGHLYTEEQAREQTGIPAAAPAGTPLEKKVISVEERTLDEKSAGNKDPRTEGYGSLPAEKTATLNHSASQRIAVDESVPEAGTKSTNEVNIPASVAVAAEHKSTSAETTSETSPAAPQEAHDLSLLPLRTVHTLAPDSLIDLFKAERREASLKGKSRWDLLLYAGGNRVTKRLSGDAGTLYLDRRADEEQPAYLPYAGLQLSKSSGPFDIRAGFEFSVVGEQVKYSPYSQGQYYHTYQDWEPYSYTVTDTDSMYVFGILFLNTRLETVNDSNYVTKTDTLNGRHYDASLLAANGTNRWYIAEVPVEIAYTVRRGRWGIGLSAGLAPGLVVETSARYLKASEEGYTRVEKDRNGQFTLNARAGLEFSYLLNTNCRLLLRPNGRHFLTPIRDGNNARQHYRSYGINAGILYLIR